MPQTLSPEQTQLIANIRATLNERLAAVEALPDDGYVRAFPTLPAFIGHVEGEVSISGLEHATIYTTVHPNMLPIRNRAGNQTEWMRMDFAKDVAILSLRKALAQVEQVIVPGLLKAEAQAAA